MHLSRFEHENEHFINIYGKKSVKIAFFAIFWSFLAGVGPILTPQLSETKVRSGKTLLPMEAHIHDLFMDKYGFPEDKHSGALLGPRSLRNLLINEFLFILKIYIIYLYNHYIHKYYK